MFYAFLFCHLENECSAYYQRMTGISKNHINFVSPGAYPINSIFSVLFCFYNIHVFNEAFFPLNDHCYDN